MVLRREGRRDCHSENYVSCAHLVLLGCGSFDTCHSLKRSCEHHSHGTDDAANKMSRDVKNAIRKDRESCNRAEGYNQLVRVLQARVND